MSMKYDQVGVAMTCRSYQEYLDMFMLQEIDFGKGSTLDVAAGASSFVQELNRRGYSARAVDPLYRLSKSEIEKHGLREIEESTKKLAQVEELFNWDYYGTLEQHYQNRLSSLALFAADYGRERVEPELPKLSSLANQDYFVTVGACQDGAREASQRYVAAALPELPFADDSFSFILCSHFLFLYQEQFSLAFHVQALRELVRVCAPGGQMRVYPLVGFRGEQYPLMNQLRAELEKSTEAKLEIELRESSFQFLKGANQILVIHRK